MLRTVLIVVGWIIAALILINVALHLVGLFMGLAMVLGVVILSGAPIFFFFKMKAKEKADAKPALQTKIYEPEGLTRLFMEEPTPTLLLTADTAVLPENYGLTNDTIIEILKENDRHSVKIRVKSGPHKDKTGWVSSASIVRS